MTDEEKEAMDAIMARLSCPIEIKIGIAPKIETHEFKDYTGVYGENNAKIDDVLSRIEHLQPEEIEILEYHDRFVINMTFPKPPKQEE